MSLELGTGIYISVLILVDVDVKWYNSQGTVRRRRWASDQGVARLFDGYGVGEIRNTPSAVAVR
jgi:hypothetical protein